MTGNFIMRNKKILIFGAGVYSEGGKKFVGKECQVVKKGMEFYCCGEEYNEKKNERGSNINDIKAIGKNIM